jgi:hypothetical protein
LDPVVKPFEPHAPSVFTQNFENFQYFRKFRKWAQLQVVQDPCCHQRCLAAVEIGKRLSSVTPEFENIVLKLETGVFKFQKHRFQIRMLPP